MKESAEQNGRRTLLRLSAGVDMVLDDMEGHRYSELKMDMNSQGFKRRIIIDNQLYTIEVKRGGSFEGDTEAAQASSQEGK